MKRLAKLLAVLVVVVILAGIFKSMALPAQFLKAAGVGQISVIGPNCGPNDPNNPVSASELPDINTKLRGFELVPNSEHDVVDYTGQFSLDVDPKSPNLNDLFDDGYDPIAASFRVGTWDGSGLESDPWLNATAFQTKQGEQLFVPDSGYDIGDGYEVMVLYADDNSITIKYTREDNIVSGYAIHVMGIDVNPEILELYEKLDKEGRKQLPALHAGDLLGTAMGPAILVEYRDTGAFLDPRSCVDHWDSCKKHPDQQPTISEAAVVSYLKALGLDQRNAERAERQPQCDVTYLSKYPKYPPLGSLQSCPPEFPTELKKAGGGTSSPPPSGGGVPAEAPYCGGVGVVSLPEPQICQNPPEPNSKEADDFCNGPTYAGWCRPDSCKAIAAAHKSCAGKDHDEIGGCGKFFKFCDDPGVNGGNGYWLNRASVQGGCQNLSPDDKSTIGYCYNYKFGNGSSTVSNLVEPELPRCVPTKSSNNRCTSACGTPLKIEESLAFTVSGNCATGQCKASIKIQDETPLFIPFAKKLSNYFAGTFDAGAVADGYISKEELERIRKEVAEGNTDAVNDMFANAGVARKLLPMEIQNQLKCEFIKGVVGRMARKENTKYAFIRDGKQEVFKIDDIPITDFASMGMPPYFDKGLDSGCGIKNASAQEITTWSLTSYGAAWKDVPMFDNEDSQGKIEFVSGGVFTPELNPIQTSIPEIRRLYNVTRILQKALSPNVPVEEIADGAPNRYPLISDLNPEKLQLTIGPEITPGENLLVCKKNTPTLEEIYGDKKSYALEPETSDYTLGVDCIQQNAQSELSDSKVCVVGPEGQLNCFQQLDAGQHVVTKTFPDVKVQVRNVTPYLYDAFLQTIQQSGGFLRIFKPVAEEKGLADQFEASYSGFPAESNAIKYKMDFGQGVKLAPGQSEWKLLFDKLGGIWTARNFVLDLLNPPDSESTNKN